MNGNISHPWPEWVSFIETLSRERYFEGNREPFSEWSVGAHASILAWKHATNYGKVTALAWTQKLTIQESEQGHMLALRNAKCNFLKSSRNIKCFLCGSLNEEKVRQIQEVLERLPLEKGKLDL
ncbi:hypothetical protein SAY86_002791 [Trapa natans]|uniref:Uncharacterized protein n=1 Tax=Trapa natans TaxID=22666 RepID=A0AAN7LG97_TRANT|nr:hypothetical protein SAY86_002791 [Trapa natans]